MITNRRRQLQSWTKLMAKNGKMPTVALRLNVVLVRLRTGKRYGPFNIDLKARVESETMKINKMCP